MNKESRTIEVLHLSHRKEDKGLALFPFGVRLNKELTELRKGDFIQFLSGEKREVVSVAVLGLNTAIAEQMCRYIYNVPLATVIRQWGVICVQLGLPRDSMNKDRCLQIHYKI